MAYSESDLIIPVLTMLQEHGEVGMSTSELIRELSSNLDLSDDDKRLLKGRNDSHFSQIVRNLVSHRTLVNKGLVKYFAGASGRHIITQDGIAYLLQNKDVYEYVASSGFDEEDRNKIVDKDYADLVIEEGFAVPVIQKEKRKRSRLLTELAREHYAVNGILHCHGCNFSFNDFYGPTARNYIEIHHLKPIFTYEDGDKTKIATEALKGVRPLCSNCHRMVHRNANNLLSIPELAQLTKNYGVFTPLS
jgi:hypothetical protein